MRALPNCEAMIVGELRKLAEFARRGETWQMTVTVKPGVPPEKAVRVEFESDQTRRLK